MILILRSLVKILLLAPNSAYNELVLYKYRRYEVLLSDLHLKLGKPDYYNCSEKNYTKIHEF